MEIQKAVAVRGRLIKLRNVQIIRPELRGFLITTGGSVVGGAVVAGACVVVSSSLLPPHPLNAPIINTIDKTSAVNLVKRDFLGFCIWVHSFV